MRINIASKTDVGLVRDHNEDNFIIGLDPAINKWDSFAEDYKIGDKGVFIVIADGMGGMEAGEFASKIAVETSKKEYLKNLENFPKDSFDKINLLKDIIKTAHKEIIDDIKNNSKRKGMGTTILMAIIIDNHAYIAWSGDSRAYRFNESGINPTRSFDLFDLEIITNDHSVVWEYVQSGNMTSEEARTHSHSNIITQSLGNEDRPINPDVTIVRLNIGDKLLFCSDGLNSMLPDQKISDILKQNKSVEEICDILIEEANKQGGHDNITLSLVEIVELDENVNINDRVPVETEAIVKIPSGKTKITLFKYGKYLILLVLLFGIGYISTFLFTKLKKGNLIVIDNIRKDSINNSVINNKIREDSIYNKTDIKKEILLYQKNSNEIKNKTKTQNKGEKSKKIVKRNQDRSKNVIKNDTFTAKKIANYKERTKSLLKKINALEKKLKEITPYTPLNKTQRTLHKSIGKGIKGLRKKINEYFIEKTNEFRYKLLGLETKIPESEKDYKKLFEKYNEFLNTLPIKNENEIIIEKDDSIQSKYEILNKKVKEDSLKENNDIKNEDIIEDTMNYIKGIDTTINK